VTRAATIEVVDDHFDVAIERECAPKGHCVCFEPECAHGKPSRSSAYQPGATFGLRDVDVRSPHKSLQLFCAASRLTWVAIS